MGGFDNSLETMFLLPLNLMRWKFVEICYFFLSTFNSSKILNPEIQNSIRNSEIFLIVYKNFSKKDIY